MPIDPRIALQLQVPDIAGAIRGGLDWHDDRKLRKDKLRREEEFRAGLGDMILAGEAGADPRFGQGSQGQPGGAMSLNGGGGGAVPTASLGSLYGDDPAGQVAGMEPAPPADGPAPAGMDAKSARMRAFERMVAADPVAAMEASRKHLDMLTDRVDMVARLAGSSVDQSSYDRALAQADRLGLDIGHLPRQFDPNIVNQVLNQALTAKDRLGAMRADRKLDWDIEDDQIDNERDDLKLDSLDDYREGQLANTRRGQDLTDRRGRRGQDLTSADRRRGQDMTDSRGRRGQELTDKRVRESAAFRGTGRGRAGRAGRANSVLPNEPTARDAQGRILVVRNGKWVPANQ